MKLSEHVNNGVSVQNCCSVALEHFCYGLTDVLVDLARFAAELLGAVVELPSPI